MSLARTVARNSLWSGLDMLVDTILPPLASILVARAMGPAKLGAFSYVMWISTTATALGASGISAAVRKYMADCAGQRRPEVFRALLRTGTLALLVVQSALMLLGLGWAQLSLPAGDRWFASLAMLAIVPGGLMYMASSANSAVQDLRPNVIASIASGLVHTVGLLLTVIMGWGLVGLAAASLASRTSDCVVRWILTARRLPVYLAAMRSDSTADTRAGLPPGMGREVLKFTAESTVLTVLTLVVWNRSEMLFLKRFSAIEQVGYYSVAFGLSLLPGQLVAPFSRAASVSVYAEQGRSASAGLHVTHVYWRYLVLLVMPACMGLTVLAGPLLRLLYGARYYDAAPILTMAGALSMFGPLAAPAMSLVTAAGGQKRLVTVGLLSAVVTLSLDYFLVRAYAGLGGALANGLGQAVSTLTILWVARRYSFSSTPGFFFRVAGLSVGMAVIVALAVAMLPDLGAIAVGPVLGAIAYLFFLRIAGIVDEDDVARLGKAEALLPSLLRGPYRRLLQSIAKPAATAAETAS